MDKGYTKWGFLSHRELRDPDSRRGLRPGIEGPGLWGPHLVSPWDVGIPVWVPAPGS